MTERDGKPARRLRSVRPDAAPQDETAAAILPGSPRVAALDALLREVDGLRLTLETDLSLAAAAVEAGAPGVAADIIDSDRDGLRAFENRALGHISELAAQPPVRRHRWARVSAAPFVAAAAIVGFLVGVVPSTISSGPGEVASNAVSAQSSLEQLTTFAAQGQTREVRSASLTLHDQIAALVNLAKNDPEAAQQALLLLSYERDAIVQSGDSAELRDVLASGAELATRIRNSLPVSIRSTVPVAPSLAAPTLVPSAEPAPTSSRSAWPRPTTSPTTRPSASSKPTPKTSSSPSASPSQPPIVPANPAAAP